MRASGAGGRRRAAPLLAAAAAVLVLACANVKHPGGPPGSAGAGVAGTSSGAAGVAGLAASGAGGAAGVAGTFAVEGCGGACTDFPDYPLGADGMKADPVPMFPEVGASVVGPCITEPEDGALFPNNWLRPRIKWIPTVPGALHQLTIHADMELHDLVAYTTSNHWELPRDVWQSLAAHVRGTPVTVTVRAAGGGSSTISFTIAPVPAPGSVVFWATNPADHGAPKPTSSSLKGFAPGDESTVTTLAVPDVQMQTRSQNNGLRAVTCIGCHNSTPDGESVGFLDNYPWSMAIAGVLPGRTGLVPTYVTPGGVDTIRQPGMGIFSFSKAHWAPGDRIAVSPYYLDMPCGQYKQTKPNVSLVWLDLEAPPVDNGCPVEGQHFGVLARDGDPNGAANPTWSHDGNTIVYSSTTAGQDGRLALGPSDLYSIPYTVGPNGKGQGGTATPLPGASDPAFEEYYPAFSPDDALVVFDRVPAGSVMYANPRAELFVVPAPGAASGQPPASATRLAANDPPACTGLASPGINNHWAKWAPAPERDGGAGKTYYWLIFSSNRYGTPPVIANDKSVVQVSQLYITAIVVDATSTQTFPAIYLWNQSAATLNTTPAWDPFKIPIVP
jgi:hypothetical protein